MKKTVFRILAGIFFMAACYSQPQAQSIPSADSVLKIMKKTADWQLRAWKKQGMQWPENDWTNGAAYTGFMALNAIANDPGYSKAMYRIGEDVGWNTGPRRFFADDYCVGQMFSEMYAIYKKPEMIKHFRALADSILERPHTESLEWKNSIQLREWAWCDALFMGPPALAYLSTATGERKYLDMASKLWWKTTDYLFDPSENLYTRDSRYFNSKEANGKKMFWSRGNGWVMAGLVRMLDNMPADYPDRSRFVELLKKMSDKIATLQSPDGSWHAALLDAESYPAKETSGTAFYCYALAYGVNHGLLDYNHYKDVISKAWDALSTSVHKDGKLGNVQQIGEKPELVNDNSTEVYGVGGFLLAGSEIIKLQLKYGNENSMFLQNPSGLYRHEEVVEIPYEKVSPVIKTFKEGKFIITDILNGKEIPYQLEYHGEKDPVHLLISTGFAPGSGMYIRFREGAPAAFEPKTYARFVPERYDDFAWENDKITFRVYGAALEKTNENAYGHDVWAKRTPDFVINKWYKSGDYHKDHGEGLDFYDVGLTLGDGSNAPYVNDSIYYSKNFRRNKVLDNGPLRSTFQLDYDEWNVNGTAVKETKIISLDAGSQLYKVQTVYSFKGKQPLSVAIGIVTRKGNGTILLNQKNGIMGYWEPQHGKDGTIGTGAVIPSDEGIRMTMDAKHLLGIIQVSPGKPFSYYTGAAWDKAGLITDSAEWFLYLNNFAEKIQQPVTAEWIKNK